MCGYRPDSVLPKNKTNLRILQSIAPCGDSRWFYEGVSKKQARHKCCRNSQVTKEVSKKGESWTRRGRGGQKRVTIRSSSRMKAEREEMSGRGGGRRSDGSVDELLEVLEVCRVVQCQGGWRCEIRRGLHEHSLWHWPSGSGGSCPVQLCNHQSTRDVKVSHKSGVA